jgi:Lon-like ATP-dependent protease
MEIEEKLDTTNKTDDEWKKIAESLFFIGKEYCEKTEVHKKGECEANKIAKKLLNLYASDKEAFEKELNRHLIEEDAQKVKKAIYEFEKNNNLTLEEIIGTTNNPRFTEYYNQIFSTVAELLHTDRKDESGMRNEDWLNLKSIKNDIKVPSVDFDLLEYLIGQDEVKDIMYLIGYGGVPRNVEMYGPPGTGKSLAAEGLSQLLYKLNPIKKIKYNYNKAKKYLFLTMPRKGSINEQVSGAMVHMFYEKYVMPKMLQILPRGVCDVLAFYNYDNPNRPFIRILPPGWGIKFRDEAEAREAFSTDSKEFMIDTGFSSLYSIVGYYLAQVVATGQPAINLVLTLAPLAFIIFLHLFWKFRTGMIGEGGSTKRQLELRKRLPVILVNNESLKVPFVTLDSTNPTDLLGTTQHDPYGGVGRLEHESLRQGKVHEGNGGVVYVDEAEAVFNPQSHVYQTLVAGLRSAMEDGMYGISFHGGTEGHTMAQVTTFNKLPTRFILIVAGNKPITDPAIRNRIFARGYQVNVNDFMPDTPENRRRTIRFIRQWMEIEKSRRNDEYLDMDPYAATQILEISKSLSSKSGSLTVLFRSLGGYIMAANDLAKSEGSPIIKKQHVEKAFETHSPMEIQEIRRALEKFKPYKSVYTNGYAIGVVNGLTVAHAPIIESIGVGDVTPIEIAFTPRASRFHQEIWWPEKFQEIARDSVKNAVTVFKKIVGKEEDEYNPNNYDYKINFVQVYQDIDGDSATIAILAGLLSELYKIPVDQSIAVTGSLRGNGEILPVGGVKAKIEAAKRYGLKKVIIPEKNKEDANVNGIEICYGERISDYLIKYGLLKFDENNPKHKELIHKIYKFEEKLDEVKQYDK